ncbi:MAG: hypothetical protein KGL95_14190, partial [Patescibacteria group bacterium]|nr:hypothetical protein [Patescibacteria group bacterium]
MSNDSNPEKLPSDKEIKKFMKDFIHEFKPYAAKLTGENMSMHYDNNDLQNIKNFIELANDYNRKENSIASEDIAEHAKLQKRMDLTDDILKSILGLTSDNPALELAQISNPKNSYEKIIPDINYRTLMRGTIHKVLHTIDQMGKL